jgi:hypothetical protein
MKNIKSIWEWGKPVFKRYWKLIISIIIYSILMVGWAMGNEWVKTFASLSFLLWLCILGLVYALKSEQLPVSLVDLRKVKGVEAYPCEKLRELYFKETGRSFSDSIYPLMLPDEKAYVEWLENKTTRYLMLNQQDG